MIKKTKSIVLLLVLVFSAQISPLSWPWLVKKTPEQIYQSNLSEISKAIDNIDISRVEFIAKKSPFLEEDKQKLLEFCDAKIKACGMGVVSKEKRFSKCCRYLRNVSIVLSLGSLYKYVKNRKNIDNGFKLKVLNYLMHLTGNSLIHDQYLIPPGQHDSIDYYAIALVNLLIKLDYLTILTHSVSVYLFSLGIKIPNQNNDLCDLWIIKNKILNLNLMYPNINETESISFIEEEDVIKAILCKDFNIVYKYVQLNPIVDLATKEKFLALCGNEYRVINFLYSLLVSAALDYAVFSVLSKYCEPKQGSSHCSSAMPVTFAGKILHPAIAKVSKMIGNCKTKIGCLAVLAGCLNIFKLKNKSDKDFEAMKAVLESLQVKN